MYLLIGGDSEIAQATGSLLRGRGDPVLATTRRRERVAGDRPLLDLSASLADWQPPQGTQAACIFAAVARLAACAADPAGSEHVNVTQTLLVAERLLARDIPVLFLSTNQVFDGAVPHVSADAPYSPISEYGRQKARAEAALRGHFERGAPVAILRLAKVVPLRMPLICGWTQDLSAGRPVRGFGDMTLAPAPMDMVAGAIAALLDDAAGGVYQFTGPRDVSYAQVARYVAKRVGAADDLVHEIPAREAGMPEGATPRHTTLDSSRLSIRYGLTVPDAWEVVEAIIAAARGARRAFR